MEYEVDILVKCKPVRKIIHNSKCFIEGRFGQEYEIRIKNNTLSRILAVIAVDGVNVVDGEIAGKPVGYVINGWSAFHGKGFRVSNEVVHPFKFSSKDRSYAAKSNEGDTSNVGVIGVEVYEELVKPTVTKWFYAPPSPPYVMREPYINPYLPLWYEYTTAGGITNNGTTAMGIGDYSKGCVGNRGPEGCNETQLPGYGTPGPVGHRGDMGPAGPVGTYSCSSPDTKSSMYLDEPRGFDMGTEFSRREVQDKVVDVNFEIGNMVQAFTIYYASLSGLKSMGVPVERQTQIKSNYPNPFPNKFCKPPKW